MEYFEVPEANPGQDGICSDNDCPCGYPGATIPRGKGYMYISPAVVDFRRDARTTQEAAQKMAMMEKRMNGMVIFGQDTVTATFMCEQGARKRGLDLAVAAADAEYWWKTGLCPLRATPLAGQAAPKPAAPQTVYRPPAQARPVVPAQPVIVPAARKTEKSPVLAAVLSFFLFGGAGQVYLGQWKKGLALILASWMLSALFIGIPIYLIGIGDAYGTAQKLKNGEQVGDWQFNINWKVTALATLIAAVIGVALYLVSGAGTA